MAIRVDGPTGRVLVDFAIPPTQGSRIISVPMLPMDGVHDLYLTFSNPSLPDERTVAMVEWMAFRPHLAGADDPVYADKGADFVSLLNHPPPSIPIVVENPSHIAPPPHTFDASNIVVHGAAG